MAGLRFTELQSRPIEFLDFTSLTLDEFQQLVPPFEAAVPRPDGSVADGWETSNRPPLYRVPKLPPADPGRSAVVYPGLPENVCAPGRPGTLVRHGSEQSESVDSCPPARTVGDPAHPRR